MLNHQINTGGTEGPKLYLSNVFLTLNYIKQNNSKKTYTAIKDFHETQLSLSY